MDLAAYYRVIEWRLVWMVNDIDIFVLVDYNALYV